MSGLEPVSDNGKLWAILSYAGLVFGLPVALVPLVQRNDAFALHHAKTATAVWLGVFAANIALGMIYAVIIAVTCGMGFILYPILLPPWVWGMVVGLHGLIVAANGSWEEPVGGLGLGERLFGSIDIKPMGRFPPTR